MNSYLKTSAEFQLLKKVDDESYPKKYLLTSLTTYHEEYSNITDRGKTECYRKIRSASNEQLIYEDHSPKELISPGDYSGKYFPICLQNMTFHLCRSNACSISSHFYLKFYPANIKSDVTAINMSVPLI